MLYIFKTQRSEKLFMDISGINLGAINPGDNGRETKAAEEITKQTQAFNPNAQVISSQGVQRNAAAQARLLKNKEADELEDEKGAKETEDKELEVATLGLIKLSEKQLKEFEERIEGAIYRQEQEIMDAVRTFAGNEKTLRQAIGSVLLS